ncbi:hypothetical protein B0H17DRAFT_1139109 [Mycena rosella]|uniref:Uncharacterized protein n=1 Tax=Mycena rosella TaxID=1033263 RepID=A0AAD7D529_MYCRO|nr:hypothetical protein B0H17DRAFT_1139109 [Mycena rosella]
MDPPLHPVHPPVRSSTVHNPDVEHNTGSFPRMSDAGATHHDYSDLGPLPSTQIQLNIGPGLVDDLTTRIYLIFFPLLHSSIAGAKATVFSDIVYVGVVLLPQRQHRESVPPSNSTRNEYAFMYVAYPPARM